MKRVILESVRAEGGTVYKPGDEEKLATDFDQKKLDALAEKGIIAGNWKSFQDAENFLSLEETMQRFEAGDEAEIVYQSLRYHQRQRKSQLETAKENKESPKKNGKP